MRYLGLASLLTIFLFPVASFADDSITLQLPAFNGPETQSESDSPKLNSASASKVNPAASVPTASRRGASVRSQGETVVGRLGVSNREAPIRASRSSRSHIIASVNAGTYLALSHETSDQYGVLMSNGTTGWVKKRDVNVLDYAVVAPESQMRQSRTMLASRGGAAMLGSGVQAILQEAYKHLGVPYRYGGTSTSSGIDCSAFVQQCFASVGVGLPRTAHEQAGVGMPVSVDDLQAGDRLYFAGHSGNISHTGIYIGNGYFIHASSSNHGVAVSRLTETMYSKMFAGARR